MNPEPVAFLDRDGVINRRIPGVYLAEWAEFDIMDGVVDAIARLNRAGLRTVVVTNQRGIAIGKTTADEVDAIHRRLSKIVGDAGGVLNEFYVCPHDYDTDCTCRKPKPGLLDQAAEVKPVDWSRSYLVGDSDADIRAGQARKVGTLLVRGKIGEDITAQADWTCASLAEAADLIVKDLAARDGQV